PAGLRRPDATLRDDEGLPVLTARIAELDAADVERALRRNLASIDDRSPVPARAVRALASLAPLIDELGQSVAAWAVQGRGPADQAAGGAAPADATRLVRVLAAWPGDWDE